MTAVYRSPVAHGVDATRWVLAFLAGFLAVLIFHQPVLAFLNSVGFVKAAPYAMQATRPFGVPQVLSLSFWGGVWGILFALAERRFPRGTGYWIASLVFGAILPTLVAWSVVATLKGLPLAAGGNPHGMATGLLVNGAWGIGTALLLQLGSRTRAAL